MTRRINKNLPHFANHLGLTVALFGLLVGLFFTYAWSEKEIDRANDLRHQSFLLADELRQSSDDLTRMARTYVINGDVRFKLAYQAILDIRDGKKPRPTDYQNVYWDTLLAQHPVSVEATDQAVALLVLMQQAGFTAQELEKLTLAKTNSDQLTRTETIAMSLVEVTSNPAASQQAQARLMLHDAKYHSDKAAIMQPIKEFYALVDQRTLAAVKQAQNHALVLRWVFVGFALSLLTLLLRARRLLRATLGGTADEVFAHISRIGQGDLEAPIVVPPGDQNSVLGWLAKTQISLRTISLQHAQALAATARSEVHLRSIIEAEPECIKIVDARGRLLEMNPAGLVMIEADSLAQVAGQPVINLIAPEYRTAFNQLHQRVLTGASAELVFEVLGLKGGRRWLETHAVPLQHQGQTVQLAITRDITGRKQAEEALRIAATAFESQQGMVITNAQHLILRVNQAFTTITGYSAEEAVGQTPHLLASGRHDPDFYAAMTHTLTCQGAWAGEIWNQHKSGRVYPEWLSISAVKDEAGTTTHYVGIFNDISERKTAQAELDRLAFYDPLTQLPNRRLLLNRLDQALLASTRHARQNALLFVDLDNFKTLNDTLGHHQGDLLLVQVAQRLTTCLRDGDTVSHLGSDEFVVMLGNLSEDALAAATQAETVADKILAAFVPVFELDPQTYHGTPASASPCLAAHLWSAASSHSNAPNWPCSRPRRPGATPSAFLMPRCRPG